MAQDTMKCPKSYYMGPKVWETQLRLKYTTIRGRRSASFKIFIESWVSKRMLYPVQVVTHHLNRISNAYIFKEGATTVFGVQADQPCT